jgi:MSHA pilin protein MshD
MYTSRHQRGMTLIELIVFIVIVSTALAGVLTVLNITAKNSADPMITKQMLAIAEAILEEVELRPFTWCDPDDPQAATATSSAVGATGCTSAATVEAAGPETIAGVTESRNSATNPFDNVNDYHGLTGINTSVSGTAMPAGYSASIAVSNDAAFGPAAAQPPGAAVLRIAVTVSRGGESVVLEGYRTRHSPNFLP